MSIAVDGKINREERLPCVLVVDGSESMTTGNAIGLLNQGLAAFQQDLKSDEMASLRVRVLVVRVGGTADVAADWTDAINFAAPVITANGSTPLGAGIDLALSKIEQQMDELKANGIARRMLCRRDLRDKRTPTPLRSEGDSRLIGLGARMLD